MITVPFYRDLPVPPIKYLTIFQVANTALTSLYWKVSSPVLNRSENPHRRLVIKIPHSVDVRVVSVKAELSSRSASHNLMIDCRVIPNCLAFLSSRSIIHNGKSTLTRFSCCFGCRMVDRSRNSIKSSPLSKAASNCLAFIFFI